jgi:hypothetical protein
MPDEALPGHSALRWRAVAIGVQLLARPLALYSVTGEAGEDRSEEK